MRWYQNVEGVEEAVFKNPDRKESKFWNEGKWHNFIEPLLPEERGTFIEIGCNAGLFLKLATDAGFRDVIGIEASSSRINQAKRFRDVNKCTYKLIHQKVAEDFDVHQLPLADVVLLANAHYYLPVVTFANLVDHLKNRTAYCIIVSARVRRGQGRALHYLEPPGVRGYFRDWQEVKVVGDWQGIEGLDKDDPAPRRQMYGVSFKGNLETHVLKDLYDATYSRTGKRKEYKYFALFPTLADFFKKVLAGEEFELEESSLYKYWRKRNPEYSSEWVLERVSYKKAMAEDIQKNGMREPIRLMRNDKILDGAHRLAIAKELGYKHILVRQL